jgi:hypothetical protein
LKRFIRFSIPQSNRTGTRSLRRRRRRVKSFIASGLRSPSSDQFDELVRHYRHLRDPQIEGLFDRGNNRGCGGNDADF